MSKHTLIFTDKDINYELSNSKNVLFITAKEVKKIIKQKFPKATVVSPMANIRGKRFDVIVYYIPIFTSYKDIIKFSKWVINSIQPTLEPNGIEGDYVASPSSHINL